MQDNLFIWFIPVLLLPVFFGMGWLAARVDLRAVVKEARAVPRQLYKSLEALIDRQNKEATSLLSSIVEEKKLLGQTADSYELAMIYGKLLRQSGEHDKVISLHQDLLQHAYHSSSLAEDKKWHLQLELGQDYQAAGLVDRAEKEFESLLSTPLSSIASKELLTIYQQDRNWIKAIELTRKFPGEKSNQLIKMAHFYCELARDALIQSQLNESKIKAQQALSINKKCARANIILGDSAAQAKDYEHAIACYTAIEKQSPPYLNMVAENIYNAYEQLHKAEAGLYLLIGYAQNFPELDLINLIYQKALLLWPHKRVNELALNLIRINPNLKKIYLLITILREEGLPSHTYDIDIIKKTLSNQVTKTFMYQCKNCCFRSRIFFWHCPACGRWETFSPNKIEVK